MRDDFERISCEIRYSDGHVELTFERRLYKYTDRKPFPVKR